MLRKRRMARARLSHDACLPFFFFFFSFLGFFFPPPPREPIGCRKFGATSACPHHWLPAICCSLLAARTLRARFRARRGERSAACAGGAAGPPHVPLLRRGGCP